MGQVGGGHRVLSGHERQGGQGFVFSTLFFFFGFLWRGHREHNQGSGRETSVYQDVTEGENKDRNFEIREVEMPVGEGNSAHPERCPSILSLSRRFKHCTGVTLEDIPPPEGFQAWYQVTVAIGSGVPSDSRRSYRWC